MVRRGNEKREDPDDLFQVKLLVLVLSNGTENPPLLVDVAGSETGEAGEHEELKEPAAVLASALDV